VSNPAPAVPGNDGVPRLLDGKNVPALDGLRGLAIALVLVHNFRTPWTKRLDEAPIYLLEFFGWTGVDLFFALSGLLITAILLRTRGRSHYLRNFYGRRFLRIFPLYYLALVVLWAVPFPFIKAGNLGTCAELQPWNWTYLFNIRVALDGGWPPCGADHFWSLAVEEQFYLVWPAIVAFVPERYLARVLGVALGLAVAARAYFVLAGFSPISIYVLPVTHGDALLLGSLLGVLAHRRRGPVEPGRARVALVGFAAILAAVLVFSWKRWGLWTIGHYGTAMQVAGYPLVAAVAGCLLVYALSAPRGGPGLRLLEAGWLRFLGRYSYGIYLVHYLVKSSLSAKLLPHLPAEGILRQVLHLGLLGGLSIGIAVVLYHGFERPILSLKRYFADAEDAREAGAGAPPPAGTVG
jgi:peptidoglycan/LPS O-acetylase OafA/YrhL